MAADDARYEALPWWQKAIEDGGWWLRHGVWQAWADFRFRARVRFNRAVHDYDECDWWEYASNNSRRAVTLLSLLRERHHGFKCMRDGEHDCWDGECQRLWDEALDDMIFFHKCVAGQYEEPSASVYGRGKKRGQPIYLPEFGDMIKDPKKSAQYLRGKRAYIDNYEGLWD
jgi:hypothetical protein